MTSPGNHNLMTQKTSTRLPPLLWRNARRYALQHRWQSVLGFLGIMLGVMMVVAVDLASTSARRAFELSVESVSGTVTHQIVGGSQGVPDAVFTAVRTELGVRRSAPSVSGEVRLQGQNLTVVGLDLFSEAGLQRRRPGFDMAAEQLAALAVAALATPGAVIMSQASADSFGFGSDARFTLDPPFADTTLQLAGVLATAQADAAGQLLFADIALAQQILHKHGRLDSIDLILTPAEIARVEAWLPPSLTLVAAAQRNATLEQMTEAFHVNLLAMSLLALLVAALLIYNTVSLSVLDRRATFGVLRALGTSKTQVIRLILIENAVLGAVASTTGVLAGLALGSVLVQLVTRTIDDLYFNLTVSQFLVDPWLLLKGFAWGTGITVLAAALPAWDAGRSPPITLQQKGTQGAALQRRLPWLTAAAVVLLLAGFGLLQLESRSLVLGFLALNLLIFGCCLLVPAFMQLLLSALLHVLRERIAYGWRLALRSIQSGLDRTALAVAALTVAVSVTVGVGIMVSSFRDTVQLWLDQTLTGDVQVTRLDAGAGIAPDVEAFINTHGAIARYSYGYQQMAESSLGPLRVQAASGAPDDWLYLKQGDVAAVSGNEVLISEPLASLQQLEPGDSFSVQTAAGRQQLVVSGIFHDYTTGLPVIALSQQQLLRFWPAAQPQRLTLYLAANTAAAQVVSELRATLAQLPERYGVIANSDIRALTFAIFDRTFAITDVLRLLAVVVAFVGVLSALLALLLQHLRDYAVLRASGMTIGEVARLILNQTLVLGLCAGVFALPLGILMSDVLIEVINQRSFGWSLQHSFPLSVLLQAVLLAMVAAVLAGIQPALRVAAVRPAAALRGE